MTNTRLATEFLHWLHQREVTQDDPKTVQRFLEAYHRLIAFARQTKPSVKNSLVSALRQGMSPGQSHWEFGCLANTCGVIVEEGGDPALAIAPILDRLTEQFAEVPDYVEVMRTKLGVEHPNRVAEDDWPKLGAAHPDASWVIGEWYALRWSGCAAMAMLCRDIAQRQKARERIELLQRAQAVRSDNPFAYYLAELLGMADDTRLLILDTTRQLGFRVRLTAIRNNFHLFTLLQDALLGHTSARNWQGARVRPLAVSVAKSERMLSDISPNEWTAEDSTNEDIVHDTAIWTYHTYLAMKPDGSFLMYESKESPGAPVWGEMNPMEIPVLDGERIVLLAALDAQRSWGISFFTPLHPALRSSVVVEEMLSEEQYQTWIRKILAEAAVSN